MQTIPEEALTSLGFTMAESRLYYELLRHAPATGYRLAQIVGKAPTNTYNALKVLVVKGAIFNCSGPGEVPTYMATPPDQLLSALRDETDRRFDSALDVLRNVQQPTQDGSFYQLKMAGQVMDRVRHMITSAEQVIIFDFFPEIYDIFREELDLARARGLLVAGIAYRESDSSKTMPYNGEAAELVQSRWPGSGLMLIVDGKRLMVAQLSQGLSTVLDAVYSESVFFSCVFHSALAADIRLVAFRADPSDPLKILSLQRSTPPGLRLILARSKPSS